MKMRKRIAALIAAAMIAALMPMTAFAASTNGVTFPVKVAKGTFLVETPGSDPTRVETKAPELKIELKDTFTSGQSFFITLDNAEWDKSVTDAAFLTAVTIDGASHGGALEVERTGDKTLTIISQDPAVSVLKKDAIIFIPLYTELKGGEAIAKIDGEGSVITSSEVIFATAPDAGIVSKIVVGDPDAFAEGGGVASIEIQEPFQGAYASADKTNLVFEIELRDTDFAFVENPNLGPTNKGTRIVGTRGFADIELLAANPAFDFTGGMTILKITIPKTAFSAGTRGNLELKDLGIKRVSRNAAKGDVKAVIRGDFVDGSETVVIANHTEFSTKLEMEKEYTVETGKSVEVEFTLSEELSKALVQNRAITFSLSKGAKFTENNVADITKDSIEVKAKKDTVEATDAYVNKAYLKADSSTNYNSFEMTGIEPKADKKAAYNFKATILVPNNFQGDEIKLTAEGRALSETHEVVAAKVTRPVSVDVTPMDVKVGLKQQVGGKIVIKENAKEAILRNYKDVYSREVEDLDEKTITSDNPATIDIRIGDDYGFSGKGLKILDADIEVTEGDLVLDLDAKIFNGDYIEIPVKRQSTEASTIEITNIIVDSDRTVPEGKYSVKVGGNALSKNTRLEEFYKDKSLKSDWIGDYYFDPVVTADFINITTKNTEDFAPGTGAKVVSFVIGNNKFIADGEEVEMDAAPYIKDGRTMVPLRFLARALGIKEQSIKFDAGLVTIFKADGTIIQVAVGSKNLVANGMTIPMVAAAEIIDGRTYVPVTEIGGVFGVSGSWDATTQTATFK